MFRIFIQLFCSSYISLFCAISLIILLPSTTNAVQFDDGYQPAASSTEISEIVSPRLIVELESPPLASLFADLVSAAGVSSTSSVNAKLDDGLYFSG